MNKEIVFLGPDGSYSNIVAIEINKILNDYNLISKNSFQEIHNYILENKKSIAILPVENSITTNVYENIEFIFNNSPYILGEFYLPIKLNLIGKKGDIFSNNSEVYSHPKALAQCSNFIKNNNLKAIQTNSTSNAQNMILKLNKCFAIGGKVINDNLEIKKENIGNYTNNKTRFVIVSMENKENISNKNNKISFLCKLKHEVGSLLYLLKILEKENINMTKIESKPIPDSDFEYTFLIEGLNNNSIDKNEIKKILENNTLTTTILGVY